MTSESFIMWKLECKCENFVSRHSTQNSIRRSLHFSDGNIHTCKLNNIGFAMTR